MVYRAESMVYYVGTNANGNPSLYRMRYTAAPGAGAVAAMLDMDTGGGERLLAPRRPNHGLGAADDVGPVAEDLQRPPRQCRVLRKVVMHAHQAATPAPSGVKPPPGHEDGAGAGGGDESAAGDL